MYPEAFSRLSGEIKLPGEIKNVLKIRLRHYITFYRVELSIHGKDDQVQGLSLEERAEADKYLHIVVLTSSSGYTLVTERPIHRYRPDSLKKHSVQLEPPEYLQGWWSTAEFMYAY
jgi:hypothetical protein